MCAALRPEFDVDDSAMRYAIETRSSWNALHTTTAIRIDSFVLKARAFSQREFERRQREVLDPSTGRALSVTSAEDALLAKLEWYRRGGEESERLWGDVLGLLRARGKSGSGLHRTLGSRAERGGPVASGAESRLSVPPFET